MDFDDLLQRYFGTSNLAEASSEVQTAGVDRLLVDFGLETDRAKRFALWSLLYKTVPSLPIEGISYAVNTNRHLEDCALRSCLNVNCFDAHAHRKTAKG